MRLRRIMAYAPVLLIPAAGLTANAVWPSGPRLELWRSGPVLLNGTPTQFEVLKPAGWEASVYKTGQGANVTQVRVSIRPRPRFPTLSRWLGRSRGIVELNVPHISEYVGAKIESNGSNCRFWDAGTPGGQIGYYCDNPAEFEAQYRKICESFKVARPQ